MGFEVRRLAPKEVDAALLLAWETFLAFEAPAYTPEGVANFRRDILENKAFRRACMSGENRMWGAFDGRRLAGMFAMRGESHICLAFTQQDYHRKGVATALFQSLLHEVRTENPEVCRITVHSSPYGLPFYLRMGFLPACEEQTADGIRFTPMTYEIKKN